MSSPKPRHFTDIETADLQRETAAAVSIASARNPQPVEEDPPLVGPADLPALFAMSSFVEGRPAAREERQKFLRRVEALEDQIAELSTHGS